MSLLTLADINAALQAGGNLSVRDLYGIWEQRLPVAVRPKESPGLDVSGSTAQIAWLQNRLPLATAFAGEALKKSEFLLVCDTYREAVAYWTGKTGIDPVAWARLHRFHAIARMRLGFIREAQQGLQPLLDLPGLGKEEKARILLQMGELLREESHDTGTPSVKKQLARDAQRLYEQALALDGALIEARVGLAATALVLGEENAAQRKQAGDVAGQILSDLVKIEKTNGPDFHTTCLKAITESILGRRDEATSLYSKLASFPEASTSELAEARHRAEFIAEALGEQRDYFKPAFPPLELIIFAGHNCDRPGGPSRFPARAVPAVLDMLRQKLAELQARVGMVSAAAGADLLFNEAMRERTGTSCHVVLPWSRKEFYRTSVEPFDAGSSDPYWTRLFENALKHAATVRELGQIYEPGDEVGWSFAQEATVGQALLTARALRLDLRPLCLWDGKAGTGVGGTATFVELWTRHLRQPPVVLPLPVENSAPKIFTRAHSDRSEKPSMHQEVRSMLFADVVGFSKLTEKVTRDFVDVFMSRVSILLSESRYAPRSVNTWGDAVFGVFDFAQDAGRFALQLIQLIRDGEQEWLRAGLSYEEFDSQQQKLVQRPLTMRIGLHTGPIYAHYNPILRQAGFAGSHVNRAARIEAVAPPGEIYASEEFAAMAELGAEIKRSQQEGSGARWEDRDGFVCDYAGSLQLAKNYPGRFHIYRVSPRRPFALEELAMAAHTIYCEQLKLEGATPEFVPALRPWNELSEDLRDSNRAQVTDIANKLYLLGYELAASHGFSPLEIEISPQQLEDLSMREHDRWMDERRRQGWTLGSLRDNARKLHPSMVSWDALPEVEKQKDRNAVRSIPRLIDHAGFRVRKLVRPVDAHVPAS